MVCVRLAKRATSTILPAVDLEIRPQSAPTPLKGCYHMQEGSSLYLPATVIERITQSMSRPTLISTHSPEGFYHIQHIRLLCRQPLSLITIDGAKCSLPTPDAAMRQCTPQFLTANYDILMTSHPQCQPTLCGTTLSTKRTLTADDEPSTMLLTVSDGARSTNSTADARKQIPENTRNLCSHTCQGQKSKSSANRIDIKQYDLVSVKNASGRHDLVLDASGVP
jgi:hypothetical protein